jgi:hypothetical protein
MLDAEQKGEIDTILSVGLKIVEVYMNWFMWLCGVNVVALGVFAFDAINAKTTGIALCIVMMLADFAGVGASFAARSALRMFRQKIAALAAEHDYLLGGPLIRYGLAATGFMLSVVGVAWAIAATQIAASPLLPSAQPTP